MQIDETKIFLIDPKEVKLADNLPRYRKNLPNIKELAESIKAHGQFTPVLLARDNQLIAGGRRLAACLLNNQKIRAVYKDTLDKRVIREIELEENVQREDYTPADEAAAIRDLHKLKQELYGVSTSGREGGWTLNDTAKLIGKSKGSVIDSIKIAEISDKFPELKKLKTRKAIKRASTKAITLLNTISETKKYEEKIKRVSKVILHNRDAFEDMKTIEDKSINIILTDPPFGIDINNVAQGYDGITGGVGSACFSYEDDFEIARGTYKRLAKESFRITKDNAHFYTFCSAEMFYILRKDMSKEGWDVYVRPIPWIKRTSGQCNNPDKWPSSCYEAILYARKPESVIVTQGLPNWIQCNPLSPTNRLHQAEKPLDVILDLLKRVAFPGQTLYDPFMGSGAILEAGLRMKMFVRGTDISKESYAIASKRLSKCM